MSRMTLMMVAAVLGSSFTPLAHAVDTSAPAHWSGFGWPTSGWAPNQTWMNQTSWSNQAQREEMHRRYLTPAGHAALHRGMGHSTRPLPRDRMRIPYNSYGPAAAYDARYSPDHRSSDWPSWPLPSYQFGGVMPPFTGFGR